MAMANIRSLDGRRARVGYALGERITQTVEKESPQRQTCRWGLSSSHLVEDEPNQCEVRNGLCNQLRYLVDDLGEWCLCCHIAHLFSCCCGPD